MNPAIFFLMLAGAILRFSEYGQSLYPRPLKTHVVEWAETIVAIFAGYVLAVALIRSGQPAVMALGRFFSILAWSFWGMRRFRSYAFGILLWILGWAVGRLSIEPALAAAFILAAASGMSLARLFLEGFHFRLLLSQPPSKMMAGLPAFLILIWLLGITFFHPLQTILQEIAALAF